MTCKIDINGTALAALDLLALALADAGHQWTDEQRHAYEQAVALLGDAPASETIH